MPVESTTFRSLDGDQRREAVNTRQRFAHFGEARSRVDGYRGSMTFAAVNGGDYLVRSSYDPRTGRRRQKSLGPRSPENERLKAEFDAGRAAAEDRLKAARASIVLQAGEGLGERSPMGLLRRVDRSFERTRQTFRASDRDGFVVDLVRPLRSPPWRDERSALGEAGGDLDAAGIEGLVWTESAPAFPAVAVDLAGFPTPLVASDPRAFAVHKLWLSRRADRDPLKVARDAAQARAVAGSVAGHMPHLAFEPEALRSFPPRRRRGGGAPLRREPGRGRPFRRLSGELVVNARQH